MAPHFFYCTGQILKASQFCSVVKMWSIPGPAVGRYEQGKDNSILRLFFFFFKLAIVTQFLKTRA